ncbi:putative calmodulin-binding protein [Hibiscus syriacus]|uniref:Calmodulin-binding protein n=1 Tax=Hibiscus syriacus TaxID=106335 RepID=A0A6A2YW48_HIBSY|nr:putative calmodulin-binding protein [Hibiscus syriacus]
MQLMSVDGLTRENVASHLKKYCLYLKRMQGLSGGSGGGANGGYGGARLGASADPTTDHLFASSPHHQQQQQMLAAVVGHPHLQSQYHRPQVGLYGSSPNSQFEHPFLGRQTQQPMHRMGGTPVHNQAPSSYVEDLESANGNGGRKVLTLFPTRDD